MTATTSKLSIAQSWADITKTIAAKYGFAPADIKSARIDKTYTDGPRLVMYCSRSGTAFNYSCSISDILKEIEDQ